MLLRIHISLKFKIHLIYDIVFKYIWTSAEHENLMGLNPRYLINCVETWVHRGTIK
jgi:hypothetical protein